MNKRMKKLLKELNASPDRVYIPDKKKIISGVEKKIDVPKEMVSRPIVKSARTLIIVCILIVMMAVTTVALGGGKTFIEKIFQFDYEPPTEETEGYQEEVYIPNVNEEPVTEATEATEEVEEATELSETPLQTEERLQKESSEIFTKYHQEEPEKTYEYIELLGDCAEDYNYVLTVEEILGDPTNFIITATVSAKTEEGREQIINERFNWVSVSVYQNGHSVTGGSGTSEVENRRTEYSRTFVISCNSAATDDVEVRVSCPRFIGGKSTYVSVTLEKSREVIEFDLVGQDYIGGHVYLTPIGIQLTVQREESEYSAPTARNLNTFIRFTDGSLKTFNQVFGFDTSSSYIEGSDRVYKYQVGTRTVLDLDTVASIIVQGIEYPVDEPEAYYRVSIPENLKPFKMANVGFKTNGYYYVCRLKQLTDRMGATYIYEEGGVIEFTLAGKTYRLENGNPIIYVNGNPSYNYTPAPYVDLNGNMYVGAQFVQYVLGVRYGEITDSVEYLFVP